MNGRWLRRSLAAAAVVAAAVAVRFTLLAPKPIAVTVFRVGPGKVEETVTNSRAGTVKSRRRASLSPEVGGRVEKLLVREGDRVKRGQVLMQLAVADAEAQLAQQQATLEVARATAREACRAAEQAERDLVRSRSLARQEIVAQGLLEKAETDRDVTAAGCETARTRVSLAASGLAVARVALEKTRLHAPFDGVVARVKVEEGEWITPSPPALPIPPVMDVFDPDALYVSVPLDEVDLGKVRTGLAVRVTLDALPGRTIPATVVRVAPYVLDTTEQNRTFEVEVELDDRALAATLLPGTSADVTVVLGTRDGVLRVPSIALLEKGRVLVVSGSTLVARTVATGLKNWEFAEVKTGLSQGDPVVVSLDRSGVVAGARVRIEAEQGP